MQKTRMYDEQQDNRACVYMHTGVKTWLVIVVFAAYSSFNRCFRWLLSVGFYPPVPVQSHPALQLSVPLPWGARSRRGQQRAAVLHRSRPGLPHSRRLFGFGARRPCRWPLSPSFISLIYIPHPITTLTELSSFPCARSAMCFLSHCIISSLFLCNIHKSQHNRWELEDFNPLGRPATPLVPQHHPSSCCQPHTAVWHAPLSTNTSLPSSNLSGSTRGVSPSPHSFWPTASVITVFQGPFPLTWEHNPVVQTTAIISFFLPVLLQAYLTCGMSRISAPHSPSLADPIALVSCAGQHLQAAES